MSGFFGAATKTDCVFDVFFGTDYHSHLGTRRAGMAFFGKDGFTRSIHNVENSPFRTKFDDDIHHMKGNLGIGCISDYEAQPLIVRSHHGTYAITTVGKINNCEELAKEIIKDNSTHFLEMSGGAINATELVATLINQKDNLIDGIRYAQSRIDGSMTLLILTAGGIYCARDRWGRTPLVIGQKKEGFCAAFESFSYVNLGYRHYRELGPGEIAVMTPEAVVTLVPPGKEMRICTFLWVYYGYPSARYEGVSVEEMRYRCGAAMAKRDGFTRDDADVVAAVPDSGIAHAVGYANESGIPFSRPLIKYTPTWPRSFMPTIQSRRNLIAKMKLIPIRELIEGNRMILVDDSIVRGTQLREQSDFLFHTGAKEIHARPACPPIMFGCKYVNFSRSNTDMELVARQIIAEEEGVGVSRDILDDYANPDSSRYACMVEGIRKRMGFTSLSFNRLDDMLKAVGIDPEKCCTYCWTGRE
ncbi:MAG: amidophosphoribosyltransferase [Dialister sp.]|nr:amidophosphoribosyltransferase [Dialister sp.]